ncbi:MAG TPA: 16S rRNA (cytidine(1402)-2'-O)-methyltransferase [Actinomycetota bacterium]|nr:16S rRNA (cytidine(1402)-2'-O)-methyltransferase [Actinomycetota bacterium]
MPGTLWLVGTPIGNLADLAPRARDVLAGADLVAAEDTRRTGRLLKGLGIKKPMLSLYDANERERVGAIVDALRDDRTVAVVSDAGMPLVSDPGFRVVRACIEEGYEVGVVPGPSAVLAALVLSGLPTDRFSFEGFAPRKAGARADRLEALRDDARTLVFFESPGRVTTLLRDVLAVLGDRPAALCRELTKLHEQVIRGRVSEVIAALDGDPKGEIVLVVGGAPPRAPRDLDACVDEARDLVAEGMKKREAAHAVADRHHVSVNDIYDRLVAYD